MLDKNKIKEVLKLLDKKYGKEPICFLHYEKDYELLFATILAAQCKDERVNQVTKTLFKKYDTLEKFAKASKKDMEDMIKSLGCFKIKAASIIESAKVLINDFNGKVPSDIDKLCMLKGVGRKTANVVRTHVYNIPSIVVDTHVKRTSRMIGLAAMEQPEEIEYELMKKIEENNWSRINSQLITLGREYCISRRPKCDKCFLCGICESSKLKSQK